MAVRVACMRAPRAGRGGARERATPWQHHKCEERSHTATQVLQAAGRQLCFRPSKCINTLSETEFYLYPLYTLNQRTVQRTNSSVY